MTAEIICVGTEILLGNIVNTNAAYLSERLASLGISVFFIWWTWTNERRSYKGNCNESMWTGACRR